MGIDYQERVGSTSPNTAGFSISNGGQASWQYDIEADDLQEALTDILGSVQAGSDGKLYRQLPKAHPQYPWLSAERISNVVGMGGYEKVDAEEGELVDSDETFLVTAFAEYELYRLTIQFTQKPYTIAADYDITVQSENWTDFDGSAKTYKHADEYNRFVDIERSAAPEVVQANQGQQFFVVNGAPIKPPDVLAGNPHGFAFQGFPRLYVPNCNFKVVWFQVPYSYVLSKNSFLVKYIGRVNQTTFLDRDPGELLYMGFNAKRYVPVSPDMEPVSGTSIRTAEKLADIELLFSETQRNSTTTSAASTNANYIVNGWNVNPWIGDLKYYYSVYPKPNDENTVVTWRPTFFSFPAQILFSNPDAS